MTPYVVLREFFINGLSLIYLFVFYYYFIFFIIFKISNTNNMTVKKNDFDLALFTMSCQSWYLSCLLCNSQLKESQSTKFFIFIISLFELKYLVLLSTTKQIRFSQQLLKYRQHFEHQFVVYLNINWLRLKVGSRVLDKKSS